MANESFQKIGYETKIGKQRWAGPVIATPDALYCALVIANGTTQLLAAGIGGGLGGAIGGAIAGAITAGSSKPKTSVAKIADVPQYLRAPDTGPFRRVKPDMAVLIVARDSISHLEKNGMINNTLVFDLGDKHVTISHSMFGPSKARQYLIDSGWPLVWRGQQFNMQ